MQDVSRRHFLGAAGALGALAVVGRGLPVAARRDQWGPNSAGYSAFAMAMHMHATFSEGAGSYAADLYEAARHNVDVIWWTDHDTTLAGWNRRRVVHFDSFEDEPEDGQSWAWDRQTTGYPVSASSVIETEEVSPGDPNPPGAARFTVTAGSSPAEEIRVASAPYTAYRNSVTGRTLTIDVHPDTVGPHATMDIRISSSNRPPEGGRPGGRYQLWYRVGGPGAPGSCAVSGTDAVVTLAAPTGRWTTLTLTPQQDIAAAWPDLDARDLSIFDLALAVHADAGETATGTFDYLRFTSTLTDPMGVRESIVAGYRAVYPSVTTYQALEMSWTTPHVSWLGPGAALPQFPSLDGGMTYDRQIVETIHRADALASWNHMYGTTIDLLPGPEQDQLRHTVTEQLLSSNALGVDLLEVGYPRRGGVDIDGHLAAWDTCSRNGLYLSGTGVTDDHTGVWQDQPNRFVTYAWASSVAQDDLLDALVSGRTFSGDLFAFSGQLDLSVDGGCPMGSVSVSTAASRSLQITARGLPAGATLELVRGPVDYAGTAVLDPGTAVVSRWAAESVGGGSAGGGTGGGVVRVAIPNTAAGFVRTQVRDAAGDVIAFSNPVWLLRAPSITPVPAGRRA